MIAALATLTFLAGLWLCVVVAAKMIEESGGKMLAALRGQSLLATAPVVAPVRVRISSRSRLQRPVHAQPRLRAAA